MILYFQDTFTKLYNADCRGMSQLEDNSIQCVVTSPPYYGLRKYAGLPDSIWGNVDHCQHEWIGKHIKIDNNNGHGSDTAQMRVNENGRYQSHESNTCSLCGAWRGQFGLEPTVDMYVQHTVEILREIRRVLRKDGVCFLNLGDSYASGKGTCFNPGGNTSSFNVHLKENNVHPLDRGNKSTIEKQGVKPKDLYLIPFRVALAAQADGWYVRSIVIWDKGNPMPESVHGLRYIRHRVTIEEYENLFGMRSTQSGIKQGPSDVQRLCPCQISDSQETISTECQRESGGESARGTSGREGETQACIGVSTGQNQQSEVRSDGEGQSIHQKEVREVQSQSPCKGGIAQSISENQRRPEANSAETGGEQAIYEDREVQSEEVSGLRSPQERDRSESSSNTRGLAGYTKSTQEPLPLLSQTESPDSRSCNSTQQGREARQGKHSTSLSELQRGEEGQDDSTLIDCPGCPKCNNGYILIKGSGRPTESHEYIIMLTKSSEYYYDSEAVKEPQTGNAHSRGDAACDESYNESRESYIGFHSTESILPAGRNLRSVWHINTRGYSEAHFATFPEALPERCIKAATPEVGCCSKCGKPWVRIVEHKSNWQERKEKYGAIGGAMIEGASQQVGHGWSHDLDTETKTLGWQPSCKCNADKVPSTVLDPFCGSGTTLWVAKKLGRRSVGYELSPQYCELIVNRNRQDALI